MQKPLVETIRQTPLVFDEDAVRHFRAAAGDQFAPLGDAANALLDGVAGCSPYLRRLMTRNPALVVEILRTPPEHMIAASIAAAAAAPAVEDHAGQLKALRLAKAKAALVIALADIAGHWSVMEAAARLSAFADAAVDAALVIALKKQKFNNADPRGCGIAIIAMGKHGACELNYSSDIDLVVLYDPDAMTAPDAAAANRIAVRATRDMVNALHRQTADGYVFRTDLRLRPDPGVTAAALPVNAAEGYYEAYGQNWERAAFIKARAAAGDIGVGERFLRALRPFIWRKYLDYAAIEDVKSIKRQIHASKGGGDIEFYGHDLKLGRGGIREIEFYAQTQQLILGGKKPALRSRATLDALRVLGENGAVSKRAADDMSEAYCYLRNVEHRLQMINDEQTHAIPKTEDGAARVAAFLGESGGAAFQRQIEQTLRVVHDHFADLFDYEKQLSTDAGSLVFTGVENHPATLATLHKMGFERAGDVCGMIRRWHASGVRATRTARARELLTKLTPSLLEALSQAGDPDGAFFAFNDFLSRLPAGVQVFSLLANNPDVFDDLIAIMTISPFLGRELARRLNFVEQLLENEWSAPPPDPARYGPMLERAVQGVHGYEAMLNAVRRWAGEQKFQITAQLAVGRLSPEAAPRHFTAIAGAAIAALAPAALQEIKDAHGEIDGSLVILGLGRLGAGEMTAMSDIDLTFIYDAPADAKSNGAKPLGPAQYYTRLVRRIVTALSAATEEGALYDVDMQLRPSGRAGPAAVSLAAFRRYYFEDAWTWEKMALIKARVIDGPAALSAAVDDEIKTILKRPRDKSALRDDVLAMRERLIAAKPAKTPWDVKNAIGGLTDINFICQFLGLANANHLGPPPREAAGAVTFFELHGALSGKNADALLAAGDIFDAGRHRRRL